MNDASPAILSVAHATFTIERLYAAKPSRVFNAFANETTKRRWFVEGVVYEVFDYSLDFRPGGREHARFRFKDTPEIHLDALHHEIVPDRRILFSYWMGFGPKVFSASTATLQFEAHEGGTKLIYTEQAAHLDGSDDGLGRERGSRGWMTRLAKELEANP